MSIQYVWNCLDDLSFMLINTMVSLPVPGIAQMVQTVLLNFIYLDILLTDLWMPALFHTTVEDLEKNGGINSFFEDNGFSSKFLIKNLGSSFVYMVVYLGVLVIYFLLLVLSKVLTFLSRPVDFLHKKLFWDYTLSLFFTQYPPMIMASIINLYDLRYEKPIEMASMIICFGLLGILPIALVASFIALYKFRKAQMLGNEDYQANYGQLTMDPECKGGNFIKDYWKPLVLIRWTLTNLLLVFGRDHPEI